MCARGFRTSDELVEALVVGSGFGGSVAALRLGRAGVPTVVLERGRRWSVTNAQDTFATYDKPDGRAAWLSRVTVVPGQEGVLIDVFTGILERVMGEGINVLVGAGIGGGSLVYNCVLYQPTRRIFSRVFPSWLDYEKMDSVWYPKVRSIITPTPLPPDISDTKFYGSTRLLLEEAHDAGLPARLLDLGVDWNVVRQEIAGTKIPSLIAGAVWYGANSGAKKSLDRNYLALAEQTGYVDILPLHVVTEVREAGRYYGVAVDRIDENGLLVEKREFRVRHLFLAAGSIGTSRLLVRAKANGTLPRLNELVGTRWGANGDVFAVRQGLPSASPSEGGPAGAVVEDLDNPVCPTVVMNMPMPQAHLPADFMGTLGMGLGPAKGTFQYDSNADSVRLLWPQKDPDVELLSAAMRITYERLHGAAAGNTDRCPVVKALDSRITGHPCGGMPLGMATDPFGRIREYPGLYVIDGSLIPGGNTACTNPALTIAALVERAMASISADILADHPARRGTEEGG